MAITINWATKIISVPQADLTFISGTLYELDTDWFRLQLKSLEDDTEGIVFLDTHRHNTEVTVAGTTFARVVEIINGYRVEFQDTGSFYSVRLVGSNNNIFAEGVLLPTLLAIIPTNSGGLIVTSSGGVTPAQVWDHAVEGAYSAAEVMRLVSAALAGKLSGAGSGTIAIRDVADTKDRITATVDSNGNRTAVTLDET